MGEIKPRAPFSKKNSKANMFTVFNTTNDDVQETFNDQQTEQNQPALEQGLNFQFKNEANSRKDSNQNPVFSNNNFNANTGMKRRHSGLDFNIRKVSDAPNLYHPNNQYLQNPANYNTTTNHQRSNSGQDRNNILSFNMSSKIIRTEGSDMYRNNQRRITQESPANGNFQMMQGNQNLYSSEVFNYNKAPQPDFFNTNHPTQHNYNANFYQQSNQRIDANNPLPPQQQQRNNTNLFDLHLQTLNRQNPDEQQQSARMMKQSGYRNNPLRNSKSSNISRVPYSMKDTMYNMPPQNQGTPSNYTSMNKKNPPLSNNSIRMFNNNRMYGNNKFMSPRNAPVTHSFNQRKNTGPPPFSRKNPPARPPTHRFAKKGSPNVNRGGQSTNRGYKIFD